MRCSLTPFSLVPLILFMLLLVSPSQGQAEELFDNPQSLKAAIDHTLLEGMISGHYGLTLKAAQFMELGAAPARDVATRAVMNKAAWLNVVNAHRMLDEQYGGVQNPETRKEMNKSLKFLDSGISLIGTRLSWNTATTKAMYGKTRGAIEARIAEIRKAGLGK